MDAVSAKTCRRVGTSPALQQEGKGKHPGGAGEMHFSAYAGRSPPRPTNGAHRQSPPPEGLGPVQILLGVLLLFSPPCSQTFYFSSHCFPPALPLPPLGPGIPVDGWVGGWMDGLSGPPPVLYGIHANRWKQRAGTGSYGSSYKAQRNGQKIKECQRAMRPEVTRAS